jgi:transposase
MFWAGFGYRSRTDLVCMYVDPESRRGGVTARVVAEVYRHHLPTFMARGDIFMHDNASVHTEHLVRDLLEEIRLDIGFEVIERPPYSPDLNPIKNLWKLLKQEIYKMYPDLETASDTAGTLERLKAAAREAWAAI